MDDDDVSVEFDEDEDDGSFDTPSGVLKKMTKWWQNELCAPCLLPNQYELVDALLDQITGMEENISKQSNKMQLRISIHRMELQRISYITSDYLRCRLQKIEKNAKLVLEEHRRRENDGGRNLLSAQELAFAQEYAKIEDELQASTALETLRPGLKKLVMPGADDKHDMVYAQVLEEEIGSVSIPDWTDLNAEVILEMEQFSVHLIPFNSIKQHVEDGVMQLL